jgi:hypothetical protein
MTESSPQNCSTVAVAVNTHLVSLMLCFIAAHHRFNSFLPEMVVEELLKGKREKINGADV